METQLEYVIRMLKKPEINVPAIAKAVNTSKQNVYNFIKRGDGSAKLVGDLYEHFKSINQ